MIAIQSILVCYVVHTCCKLRRKTKYTKKAGDVMVKVGWTLHSCFLQLYRIIFRIVQNPMLDHFIMLVVLLDMGTLMAQTFQGVTVRTGTVISFPALIVTLSTHIVSFGWDQILESWLVTLEIRAWISDIHE